MPNNNDTVSTWFNNSSIKQKQPVDTLFPPVLSNFTAGYALKVITHRYNIKKWTWCPYVRDAIKEQINHLKSFDCDTLIIEGLTTQYVRRLAELYNV